MTVLILITYNCPRTKTAPPEEDADSPQAELVAEVTNILDTLQVISYL